MKKYLYLEGGPQASDWGWTRRGRLPGQEYVKKVEPENCQ